MKKQNVAIVFDQISHQWKTQITDTIYQHSFNLRYLSVLSSGKHALCPQTEIIHLLKIWTNGLNKLKSIHYIQSAHQSSIPQTGFCSYLLHCSKKCQKLWPEGWTLTSKLFTQDPTRSLWSKPHWDLLLSGIGWCLTLMQREKCYEDKQMQ